MIAKHKENARQMLLDLKTPSYLADMAIPYLWFTPGTVDPDSQPVIEIIRSVQRGLRGLGYKKVEISGVLDHETAEALTDISGPRWGEKAWVQIVGDVIFARKRPERAVERSAWRKGRLMTGAKYGVHGLGGTVDDAGTSLTFGKGIKDPENIVPTDGVTRGIFEELQRQINRTGGGMIAVDGIIGKDTLAGFQRAVKHIPDVVIGASTLKGITTTIRLATHAYTVMGMMQGLPSRSPAVAVAPKAPKGDSTAAPMTAEELRKFYSSLFGTSNTGWLIMLGALAAGGAWYAYSQRKGKGKKGKR